MCFVRVMAAVALVTVVPGARAEQACPNEFQEIDRRLDEMTQQSTGTGVINHLTTGAVFTEEHCKGLCDAAKEVSQCMADECNRGSELASGRTWKAACNDYQTRIDFVYSDITGPDLCNGWCDIGCEVVPEDCFAFPIPGIGPYLAEYWNTYQNEISVGIKLVFCVAWAMLGCITSKSTLRQRCEGISKEDVQGQYYGPITCVCCFLWTVPCGICSCWCLFCPCDYGEKKKKKKKNKNGSDNTTPAPQFTVAAGQSYVVIQPTVPTRDRAESGDAAQKLGVLTSGQTVTAIQAIIANGSQSIMIQQTPPTWVSAVTSKGKVNMTPVVVQAPQPMQIAPPIPAARPVEQAINPTAGASFEMEGASVETESNMNTTAVKTVAEFLTSLKIPVSYEDSLAELGAGDLSHLVDLSEEDLTSVGMKPLEAKRFVRSAVSARTTDELQHIGLPAFCH